MLNVVHILWSLQRAGAELLLYNLIRRLEGRATRHSVICLGADGPLRGEIEALGCPVAVCGKRGFLDNPRILVAAARRLRRSRPDLAHIHRTGPDIWGQWIAGLGGAARVVVSEHGPYLFKATAWRTGLRRTLRNQVERTIAISEAVRDDLIRRRLAEPDRIRVIYNGVDTDTFSPWAGQALIRNTQVIGTAGRLVAHKGHRWMLGAVAELARKQASVQCCIAGDGPLNPALRQAAADLGITDRVLFRGALSDMPEFYQSLDLFVLPSLVEGFGMSLVEAMSCGLPVVASRIPGVCEIVRDGEDGLLVNAGDEAGLARAMERLLRNPEEAARLGRAARRRVVEQFGLDRMAAEYEALYLEGATGRAV